MPEAADEGLKQAILRLMDLMVEDARDPHEATALVNNVLAVCTRTLPTATPWRTCDVDGYRFTIRRNIWGNLEIGR